MAAIWEKICELFGNLVKPSRRKICVRFSPSTLQRDLQRLTKLSATANPFFNFLAELRLKTQESENNKQILDRREMAKMSKRAAQLWHAMSDEEKQPYRNLALERKKLKRLKRGKYPFWRNKSRRRKKSKSVTQIQQNSKTDVFGDGPLNNNRCILV